MPPLETIVDKYQLAVLWPRLLVNGLPASDDYGQPRVGAAQEIGVRWKDVHKEALDPKGNTITIDAEVAYAGDLTIGSVMWKGKLADLSPGQVPANNVMQVVVFNWTPDVKGRNIRQTYGLMRLKDTLPTVG